MTISQILAQTPGVNRAQRRHPDAEPLAFGVPTAAQKLGLGLTKTYELIGTGELKSFTIGARRLIAAEALDDFMARKMAEGK